MRVAITGACGFVGSNLVVQLAAQEAELILIDNFSRAPVNNLPPEFRSSVIEVDIRDCFGLQEALRGIDILIHLAAFGSVVESVENPIDNFEINVTGTFNVLEAARVCRVRKVIFASTGGALIGNATPPVTETSLPRPISPYGASKLAGEGYCSAFANAFDIDITALRFANVTGPRSLHKRGAVNTFFKQLLDSKPITIYGDGTSSRDYLDVRDLCNGIRLAMQAELGGFNVFHLASGKEVSILDLAKHCAEAAGVSAPIISFKPSRPGEVDKNFANYALIEKTLGWKPCIELQQSLADTLLYMTNDLRSRTI